MFKFSTLYKLLQRKLYDILSLQYAFLIIIIFCLLFIMSLVHFGEVWLEWSRNKYESIFSTFSDNLVEKSFYQHLCQKVPIDVVYTWVNGSDPLFLKDLSLIIKNAEEATAVNESFVSRYEDMEELRYSLRSLEMYAPWIHHVFLVTNGQIPYWLDVDHPKLTLITHAEIFPDPSHLPTFSSPAIESHLHRIPGLSKYFLYLNDDIILGKSIWPEDFLTESDGYKIFVTWNLPDCSTSCTWSWVGDGSCDPPCNIEECSYDGGDCNSSNAYPKYEYYQQHGPLYHSNFDYEIEKEIRFAEEYYQLLSKNVSVPKKNMTEPLKLNSQKRKLLKIDLSNAGFHEKSVLVVKNESHENLNFSYLYNSGIQPFNVRKEILEAFKNNKKNLSVTDIINNTNKRWMNNNKLLKKMRRNMRKSKVKNKSYSKHYFKFYNKNITGSNIHNRGDIHLLRLKDVDSIRSFEEGYPKKNNSAKHLKWDRNFRILPSPESRTLDMFAESLLHVNRLYNRAFGISYRKVPAHMPHLMNKDIIMEMQNRFPNEWKETSSHKLRSKRDMQFAFAYYYFIVGQKIERKIGEIFDEFDTDGSGTWSDREVRTILTRVYGVPLSYPIVLEFEEFINNCSKNVNGLAEVVSTPLYERYSDSKLPLITKVLIENCPAIIEMLQQQFGKVSKYKFEFIKEAQQDVTFKMITSNLSKVIEGLDIIRSRPRKFICLNNNMDGKHTRESNIVKAVLQDFYQSLYPKKSSFELNSQYRNRFVNMNELQEWKKERDRINFFFLCVFLVTTCSILCCSCQAEIRLGLKKILRPFIRQNSSRVYINYFGHRTVSQI